MTTGKRNRLAAFVIVVAIAAAIAGPWLVAPGAMLATYAAVFNR